MLGNHGRGITKAIFTPLAKVLHRLRITPDMVTIAGTVISCTLSVTLLAPGHILAGFIALTIVLFMDSVDGILARMTGTSSEFGAFLDSTLDRVADGFVFGSLLWWTIAGIPESPWRTATMIAGIVSMTAIGVVPYARAKAEAFGVAAKVGIAERTDRLIVAGVGALLYYLGLPLWVFTVAMIWVAFASSVTVVQRMVFTWRELNASSTRENL